MQLAGEIQHLLAVYLVYVIGTASPGPSNMAIMGVAMSRGRAAALALASGVVTGSLFWATLAGLGISAILASYAQAITLIKIAGGFYLLYLAWKSAKAAMRSAAPATGPTAPAAKSLRKLYLGGLLLHLTNPKAILAWIAIMSLGLRSDAPAHTVAAIIAGCAVLGITIFGGYALVFSSAPVARLYGRAKRWIEATLALMFGAAGLRLLLWRA
ncbi:LysE family translocator [Aquamicrobium sp. LC103]|uniref:LysE family translocator n=1 Tax=Aquamicrobium sp. LC103 TaxID=1120658 RepID=UPI00063E7E3F|nr:LysE family translocator [Aquamicrobium sp. LC103]TKT80346.1 LysE family translocator [Aquamicrobium sp. LC103]